MLVHCGSEAPGADWLSFDRRHSEELVMTEELIANMLGCVAKERQHAL
jgi:hypothetical protein